MGQAKKSARNLDALSLRQKQSQAAKKRLEARWQAGELVRQHQKSPSAAALGRSLQQLLGQGKASPQDVEAVARVVDLASRRASEAVDELLGQERGERGAQQEGPQDLAARTVQQAADRAVAALDMQSLQGLISEVMGSVGALGSRPAAPAPGRREEHREQAPETKKTAGLPLDVTVAADAVKREEDHAGQAEREEEAFDRDQATEEVAREGEPGATTELDPALAARAPAVDAAARGALLARPAQVEAEPGAREAREAQEPASEPALAPAPELEPALDPQRLADELLPEMPPEAAPEALLPSAEEKTAEERPKAAEIAPQTERTPAPESPVAQQVVAAAGEALATLAAQVAPVVAPLAAQVLAQVTRPAPSQAPAADAQARAARLPGAAELKGRLDALKQPLPAPKRPAPVAIPLPPKVVSQVKPPAPGQAVVQPGFTITARTESAPLPDVTPESISPEAVAAQTGLDVAGQRALASHVEADPAVSRARAEAARQAGGMEAEAARAEAPLREGAGAAAARQVAPTAGAPDPARLGADTARKAALEQTTGQMGATRVAPVPTSEPLPVVEAAPAAPPPARADGPSVSTAQATLQGGPDGIVAPTLAPAQAALGGSAPARTAAAPGAAPDVRPVSRPGGERVPEARSIAQTEVSLTGDRSAATRGIAAEAQTRSRLATEATAARAAQLAPLGGEAQSRMAAAAAPKGQVLSDGRARGSQAEQQGAAGVATQQAAFATQAAAANARAAAERAGEAARPQPQAATAASPEAQTAATAQAAQAAQAIRSQAAAQPFAPPPGVLALEAAGPALRQEAGARVPDLARAALLDQRPQLPPAPELTLDAIAAPELARAKELSKGLELPKVTFPSPPPGGAPSGGAPTREQGIANVEASIAQRMQADAMPAIEAKAAALQGQMSELATRGEQTAASHLDAATAQAAQTRSAMETEQPPVTSAQARAQAEARWADGGRAADVATAELASQAAMARTQAEAQHGLARATHQQAVDQEGARFDASLTGQWLPEYQNQHGQALSQYDTQRQAAATELASRQQAADAAAQARMTDERAQATARMQQERGALEQSTAQADASFQQQQQAAQARHDANVAQLQSQSDADVSRLHSQSDQEVSRLQAQGQTEVDQQLQQGEQAYRQQMDQGVQQAEQQRAQAEQEAAQKRAEAEKQQENKSWMERAVDAVVSAVKSLLDAAMNILRKARDAVIGIMERARQAALSALDRFRQLALDALARVKDAIQGAISAVADAVKQVIAAAAQAIRTAIDAVSSFLQACVQQLTDIVNGLIEAFQTAVNTVLDGLIAAVGFINEDWGRSLDEATAGYRAAFNQAVDGAQQTIQQASNALQQKIQEGADLAKAGVNAAEEALESAVTTIEQGLHSAVESAYTVAVDKVNQAFDRAEAAVNAVFDVAEAAVKAWFDAHIAALELVSKGVELAGQVVNAVIHATVQAICTLVDALVELIPDSVKQWFIDFWNGPWRDIIVIGLVTIAAVAITVATMGTGAPLAAMLVAGAIGATLGGAAYFGGELAARNAEQDLERDHDALYVPNFGYVKIDPATGQLIDPNTGQPIPQDQLSKMDPKQLQWAMSNFHQGPDGELTAKSSAELFDYACLEGLEGAIQGGVGAALAMSGGAAGLATAGIKNKILQTMATKGLQAVGSYVIKDMGQAGALAFIQAVEEGKPVHEALNAAGDAVGKALTPEKIAETLLTTALSMGISAGQAKYVEGLLKSQVGQSLLNIGVSTATDTLKDVVGAGGAAYLVALGRGMSHDEALALAEAAAGEKLKPESIVQNLLGNIAGEIASPSKTKGAVEAEAAAAKAKADEEAAAKAAQDLAQAKAASQDQALAQLKAMSYDELVALPQIGTAKAQTFMDAVAAGKITSWDDVDALPSFGPKTMSALEDSFGVGKGSDSGAADFKAKFGDDRYAAYATAVQEAIAANPQLASVPMDQLIAIRGYTSEDYWKINAALRNGDPAELAKYDTYIKAAEAGLAQLPSFQGTVYRGANLPDAVLDNYVAGQTVTEHAFTSTAASPSAAFTGNTKFVIQSKTGSDVSSLSLYKNEQEVLFSPGTKFKVLKVDVDPGTGFTTIYMTEQ
ncbi:MAG: hypothetical protein AMXMBFR64_40240 [Myxococcales bacterium]